MNDTTFEFARIGPAPHIAVEHLGTGPLVVFLHGIGGNRTNWREQVEAVAAEGFHAVAWDARGYGDSDDYDGPLDFSHFNADLIRVIEHFGQRAAHVVGLSMGGMTAQDFYRRHPERVLSLVLADTRNRFTRHNPEEFLRLREAPLLAGKTPADIAPGLARTICSPSAAPDKVQRLADSIAILHKDSYLKTLRATSLIEQSAHFAGCDSFVEAASIAVPTLVICGTADTITPPAMSQKMAEEIPGARLAWIDGAGHLSNIEQPERFTEALVEFLRPLRSRSGLPAA
ncbi:alpha/beta fold hydrolase [Ramlibacter sp.]|uniref:alpha/beta fold hydrolase n=1 Tax=Ramlibacter sp. TaxID=1917967 RepID=UPI003D10688E